RRTVNRGCHWSTLKGGRCSRRRRRPSSSTALSRKGRARRRRADERHCLLRRPVFLCPPVGWRRHGRMVAVAPRDDALVLLRTLRVALDGPNAPAAGEHLLVAISAGPDSTALLAALAEVAPARQLQVTAAHVDHRL